MIEYLWGRLIELVLELRAFLAAGYDPIWDTLDIVVVFLGVYWLLMLIKGTRAVQVLVGLIALLAVKLLSDLLQLGTVSWVLDNFLGYAVLIIIVLFQADFRRALARVGRGLFPTLAARQESQILEEIVRAAQTLAQKRVGALIVLERETSLDDHIETGTPLEAVVSKELLVSLFLPYSPLHDGAVVIQGGEISSAGCILPLTLKRDLPEGVGTRHRAAVGITEETDAVVIVVSEETATMSVVMGGELTQDLDAPSLRGVLHDTFMGKPSDEEGDQEDRDAVESAADPADARGSVS